MSKLSNKIEQKTSATKIANLVLTPFAFLVVLVSISSFAAYFVIGGSIDKMSSLQMQSSAASVASTTMARRAENVKALNLFNDEYDSFYEAVETSDTLNIKAELEWTSKSANANGYIWTDMNGDVFISDVDGLDASLVRQIAAKAMQTGEPVVGCDLLTPGKIADFSALMVKDNQEQELGVAFIIGAYLDRETSLDQIKTTSGLDSYVFIENNLTLSTKEDVSIDVKLDTAIISAMTKSQQPWYGTSDMLGDDQQICAIPLLSYTGKTTGYLLSTADNTVGEELKESVLIEIIFAVIVFIGVYVFMCRRLKRRLINPTMQLVEDLREISTGNLAYKVKTPRTCQEINKLVDSVELLKSEMSSVIKPVQETAAFINNSSHQLANASESLSNASNRQAASLEEISSAMEEMGANIQQNTDNSVRTNKMAEDINQMSGILGNSSKNSFEAIQNIASSIGDINDLVSQTNILALNASVEAARAGEHGVGFGVVAKEVGRLAEQTHNTARSITDVANSSIQEAEEAYGHVSKLTPMIEQITSLVKEITTASIEQNTGVAQVNTAIMDLNRVTQENAAGAEEIAASTQNLQEMVVNLEEAISKFKV